MPFLIVRNDITKMKVDAIVNAAKPSLLGGGGVDGAIHAAAGPELLEACRALGGCEVGDVRLTPGFRLPSRWVIHTVGPRWRGGLFGERQKLRACYCKALRLAREQGCESVAFPLISAGAYGFPKDAALEIAQKAITDFLRDGDMTVYLVVYGDETLALSKKRFAKVREYIDSRYVQLHSPAWNRRDEEGDGMPASRRDAGESVCAAMPAEASPPSRPAPKMQAAQTPDWTFGELDESFQQMLLRKIDQSGMTDAACYKKANIDRKLFSKIRKDPNYKPSKPTALAFAVALELDLSETRELLGKAGFALSRSSRFDLIVQYYIEKHRYDIFEINETLFAFDQALLGNQG